MPIEPLLNSVVYSLLGVVVLVACFFLIDRLTPGNLWQELLEKQNTAVAITAAGVAIAVGMIIASAIH
jgi:putative membrane protein